MPPLMRRSLALAALTLALGGGAAGCGSNDDGGGGAGETVARTQAAPAQTTGEAPAATTGAEPAGLEQWRRQVNAICRENRSTAQDVARRVLRENPGASREELTAEVLEESLAGQRRLLDRLDRVEAPAEIQGDYREFVRLIREATELTPRIVESARSGRRDDQLVTRLTEIAGPTRRFAQENGITDCVPQQR